MVRVLTVLAIGRNRPALRQLGIAAGLAAMVSCGSQPLDGVVRIAPDFETQPVASDGDAADDAVVLADIETGFARILGTDKQAGLAIYDLKGRQRDFLPIGRLNNVDAVRLDDGRLLVAASNRSKIGIDLFGTDPWSGAVAHLGSLPLTLTAPYGLCMGRTPEVSVFVGDASGNVEHWIIDDELGGHRAAVFEFDTQTEGCVYDPADGRLFVGEEDQGIWAVDPATGGREAFDRVGDGFLVADVEGLDIYADPDTGQRYLLASSQGDHTFVIYGLPDGERLLKFAVVGDRSRGIDGAEDSDGVAVISAELPGYPEGLLVVQDGYNRNPRQTQNFKGIDWRRIRSHLP